MTDTLHQRESHDLLTSLSNMIHVHFSPRMAQPSIAGWHYRYPFYACKE